MIPLAREKVAQDEEVELPGSSGHTTERGNYMKISVDTCKVSTVQNQNLIGPGQKMRLLVLGHGGLNAVTL